MSNTSSIYDLTYISNRGEEVSLAQYTGRPLLIVNTASKCGLTPQYDGLEKLHKEFADQGLVVLGFPCDQFGKQEPGDDAEISEFCRLNYGVTFPLSTKVEVNGKNAHPVFQFVKDRTGGLFGKAVKWNFTKFLVSPDGQTVKRFAPNTSPEGLREDIASLMSPAAG